MINLIQLTMKVAICEEIAEHFNWGNAELWRKTFHVLAQQSFWWFFFNKWFVMMKLDNLQVVLV